jgi:hypothetical protein
LVVIGLVVGLFILCRQRRRTRLGHQLLPKDDPEEAIPLQESRTNGYRDADGNHEHRRSPLPESNMVFEVGSDGEDDPNSARSLR